MDFYSYQCGMNKQTFHQQLHNIKNPVVKLQVFYNWFNCTIQNKSNVENHCFGKQIMWIQNTKRVHSDVNNACHEKANMRQPMNNPHSQIVCYGFGDCKHKCKENDFQKTHYKSHLKHST